MYLRNNEPSVQCQRFLIPNHQEQTVGPNSMRPVMPGEGGEEAAPPLEEGVERRGQLQGMGEAEG